MPAWAGLLGALFVACRWLLFNYVLRWAFLRVCMLREYKPELSLPPCCHSFTQLCPILCDPMDCSTPGFPVLHYLSEFAQTHVHWVSDTIQPISSSVIPFSSCPQSFPASGSFPMSQLFILGSQSIGASASASVLPVNILCWSPLRALIPSWGPYIYNIYDLFKPNYLSKATSLKTIMFR